MTQNQEYSYWQRLTAALLNRSVESIYGKKIDEAKTFTTNSIVFEEAPKAGSYVNVDLVYSAYCRCICGCGLAHPKTVTPNGYWDCSGILLGTADPSLTHTAKLPFIFYEIVSEDQPSAKGWTTRPK